MVVEVGGDLCGLACARAQGLTTRSRLSAQCCCMRGRHTTTLRLTLLLLLPLLVIRHKKKPEWWATLEPSLHALGRDFQVRGGGRRLVLLCVFGGGVIWGLGWGSGVQGGWVGQRGGLGRVGLLM
jgi:hypothetical protein